MKKELIVLILILSVFSIGTSHGQNGESAFAFLRLPSSTHISALGGTNISIVSEDNSNAFQNPALLSRVKETAISLNYMNYVADINYGTAFFSKSASKRAVWGIGMIYADYGNFNQTTIDNQSIGTFAAKDMALHGVYSYALTDKVSGGITGKAIYSVYDEYTSFALGVDLGLNYFDVANNLSLAIALKNIGGQLDKFNEQSENLPWDLQIGLSKKLAHAPFRLHLTGKYLNTWDLSLLRETVNTTGGGVDRKSDTFITTLTKHLGFGLDFIFTKNFYLAFGYNPKVADDFKVQEKKGFYGFTLGTGFDIKRYHLGASVFQQHVGGTTLMIGVSTDLKKF
ncbi:MAG: type IX secretion system protein PorQ [Bacteroidales bacterium]|nr:type IX secretion system protein PorQ [Bacteroidales bacterium]